MIPTRILLFLILLGSGLIAIACESDEFNPPSRNATNVNSQNEDAGTESDTGQGVNTHNQPPTNTVGSGGGKCSPYPVPSGVEPMASEIEFRAAAEDELEGRIIVLEPGAYFLDGGLQIVADGTTIVGATDDPAEVVLYGSPGAGSAFTIRASDVTLANLTIEDPSGNAIRVTPDGGSLTGFALHGVRIENPSGPAIVVNSSDGAYADRGSIHCSTVVIEATSDVHSTPGCPIGAIQLEATVGWNISDNHFEGFWCTDELASPVIHLSGQNQLTTIARNRFTHVASAMRIGNDSVPSERRPLVTETADDCGTGVFDDVGSTLINNMLFSGRNIGSKGFESGIVVAHACGAKIYHNTIYSKFSPSRDASIQWLYESTTADVANNLTNHTISPGDGAASTFRNNIEGASDEIFRDVATKDLHLSERARDAIDKGAELGVEDDFDKGSRDGQPDIGADEYTPST